MGTVANILTGHVTLYVKAYAHDNDPITGNTVSWSGWTALGFQSEDGLEMEYDPNFLDIMVDEHNAPVRRDLIGESLVVRFTLQEATLAQLQYAIAGATYTVASTPGDDPNLLTIGDKATPAVFSFGFEGIAATGEALIGFIPRVDSVSSVGIPFLKGGVRTLPFEFSSQADPNRSTGQTLAMLYELTATVPAQTTLDTPGLSFDETLEVVVADTSDFTGSGNIIINGETIGYSTIEATKFKGAPLTRTSAINHAPDSVVIQG